MPGRRRRATTGTAKRTTSTAKRTTSTAKRTTSTARTRSTTAAPRRRQAKPQPETPVAGPGERVWVLAVPFRAPAPGAVWHAVLQAHVWVGAELPPELAP